jgi:hypothetical protein
MKLALRLVAVAALVLGMALPAQALTITPTSGVAGVTRFTGDQTSQAQINVAIAPIIGSATELYKQNVGGPEVGPLAPYYWTIFSNSASDPSNATIYHVAGMPYIGPTAWALVKDGNQSPAWYLFNLTSLTSVPWNGTDTLYFEGFWPAQGAISHVTLYGTRVPDGGSAAMLLGAALMGLAGLRRLMQ